MFIYYFCPKFFLDSHGFGGFFYCAKTVEKPPIQLQLAASFAAFEKELSLRPGNFSDYGLYPYRCGDD